MFLLRIALILLIITLLFAGNNANAEPNITARAWAVADSSGTVIDSENISTVQPIASITKLLTVMVVLDASQELNEKISIKRYRQVSRQTLMEMALVRSDNAAADALCRHYPTGYTGCIQAMNDKAKALQMNNTFFADSTGLDRHNVSNAGDLIKLVQAASTYPLLVATGDMAKVKVKTTTLFNTNPLVGRGHGIIVSKTGFINLSGGCLVMMLNTIHGIRTIILLGSKNTRTRIPEAALLAKL